MRSKLRFSGLLPAVVHNLFGFLVLFSGPMRGIFRLKEAEAQEDPSSFAFLISLDCKGIRKMTSFHTQASGR